MGLRSAATFFELGIGILLTTTVGCGGSFEAGANDITNDGDTPTNDASVPTTGDGSFGGDTGSVPPLDDSGFISLDGFAALDGAPDPTCDPKEQPADGIFISSTVTASGDGTAALPLKTIAEGLALASAAQKTNIYLDQGTYPEQVKMTAQHSGITVQGGFRRVGAVWERDCSNNAQLKVAIASPTNIGVMVASLSKRSSLRLLSVFTKATGDSTADQGGESCYGVAVSGEGTAFALEDVIIKVGSGGAGGMTNASVAGVAATCGDDLSLCSDAADGAPGGVTPMASEGMFAPDGYVPGNGTSGMPGQPGHNGKPGAPGQVAVCRLPGCNGGGALCSIGGLNCNDFGPATVVAGPATCGCGGKGGDGGGAGHGGGASIGIYAVDKATIVVTRTQIQTLSGGNGSTGGQGTRGAVGTPGQQGKDAMCPSTCSAVAHGLNCNCEQPGTGTLKGGLPSGSGGTGGKGADGTGGAGGPSFGVLRRGGAIVTRDAATTLKIGTGGKGAGASDGATSDEHIVP